MQINGRLAFEEQVGGRLPPVCLLYGEDNYTILRERDALIRRAVTDFPEFNLYQADGRATVNFSELADSALSLPFFTDSRCAVLDDLNLDVQPASELDKLWRLLQSPSESTLLLITIRTVPINPKKKSAKEKKLFDLCDKAGLVASFQRPMPAELARTATVRAAANGCKIDREAASLLGEYVSGDTQRLISETDKLSAWADGGTITADAVRMLVEPSAEASSFNLAERILSKNYNAAMQVIDDLIFQRETPVSILQILAMSFADLYRAACARKAGISSQEAQSAYGYFGGSAYRYSKACQNVGRIPAGALGKIITLIADADLQMKTTGTDPKIVLETTVANIFLLIQRG